MNSVQITMKQHWPSLSWSLNTHQTKEGPGNIDIITFLLWCSGNNIYVCQHCRVKFKVLGLCSLWVEVLCEPTASFPTHYCVLLRTSRGTGQGWFQTCSTGEDLTVLRVSVAYYSEKWEAELEFKTSGIKGGEGAYKYETSAIWLPLHYMLHNEKS